MSQGIFDCSSSGDPSSTHIRVYLFILSIFIGTLAVLCSFVYIWINSYSTLVNEPTFLLFRFMFLFELLIEVLVLINESTSFINDLTRQNGQDNQINPYFCNVIGALFTYCISCYFSMTFGFTRHLKNLYKQKASSIKKSQGINRQVLVIANLIALVVVGASAGYTIFDKNNQQFGEDCFGLCSFSRGSVLSYFVPLFAVAIFILSFFSLIMRVLCGKKSSSSKDRGLKSTGHSFLIVKSSSEPLRQFQIPEPFDKKSTQTVTSNNSQEINEVLQDEIQIDDQEEKEIKGISKAHRHLLCSFSLYIFVLVLFTSPFLTITFIDSIAFAKSGDDKPLEVCDHWQWKLTVLDIFMFCPVFLSVARIYIFGTRKTILNMVRKLKKRNEPGSIVDIPTLGRLPSDPNEEVWNVNNGAGPSKSGSIDSFLKRNDHDHLKGCNHFSNMDCTQGKAKNHLETENLKASIISLSKKSARQTIARKTVGMPVTFRKELQDSQTYLRKTKDLEKIAQIVDKVLQKMDCPFPQRKTIDLTLSTFTKTEQSNPTASIANTTSEHSDPFPSHEEEWTLKQYMDFEHIKVETPKLLDNHLNKNSSVLGDGFLEAPDVIFEEGFDRNSLQTASVVMRSSKSLVTVFSGEAFHHLLKLYGGDTKLKKNPRNPILLGEIDYKGYPYLGDLTSNCFAPLNTNYNMKIINKPVKKYLIEKFLLEYHKYMRTKGENTYLEKLCGLMSIQTTYNKFTSVLLALNPRTSASSLMFIVTFNSIVKCTNDESGLSLTPVKAESETNKYRLTGPSGKKLEKNLISDLEFLADACLSYYSVIMIVNKRNKKNKQEDGLRTVSRDLNIQPLIINFFNFRVLSLFSPDHSKQSQGFNDHAMTLSDIMVYKNNIVQQIMTYFL